jgi:hypothetical protein
MDSQLTPALRDSEGWYVTELAFSLIVAYIQPQSPLSPSQTAADLDSFAPDKRSLRASKTAESNTSFLLEFWQTVLVIARQVPYDHSAQTRLVQLVAELKSISTMSSEVDKIPPNFLLWHRHTLSDHHEQIHREIWSRLERLENSIQESWQGKQSSPSLVLDNHNTSQVSGPLTKSTVPSAQEDSFEPFQEWININSLIFRLFGAGLIPWYYFATWTLRGALESEDTSSPKDLVESGIRASAQWIEHSAVPLWRVLREVEADEKDQEGFASTLFTGTEVLSIKRWIFWKQRFQAFGEAEAEEQVKKLAIRVTSIMNDVDGHLGTKEEENRVENELEASVRMAISPISKLTILRLRVPQFYVHFMLIRMRSSPRSYFI